ncbi:MAG: 4-hydroxy-2-oxovalerate aldolase [Filomicrobium sp.]
MNELPSQILECTLRDGSYVIDFQFTAEETARISYQLDALGFPLIEVGHGIGLGASAKGLGAAAATDEAYMAAAAESVRKGKWGMFCIPGIAELDQLNIAAEHRMDFIRVGCEVEDVAETQRFIEKARELGIYVFSNMMKSYVSAPGYFAKQATRCIEFGAQCVYIVDSAGGMLPDEVLSYADALRQQQPQVKLGFHGHNNIGMGVANALHCVANGFDVIDTSLQGFGRSAGNTPTEQFIAALLRSGFDVPYDAVAVMQAGEEFIRPLMREPGISSLDLTAGLALFHTSYMRRVLDAAREARVDPRRLIIAICEEDKVNAPQDLIARCISNLQGKVPARGVAFVKSYYGEEQT